MSNVGFKGFAKPTSIDADSAKGMLGNLSENEAILFTGGNYSRRKKSGRSACLATITEKGKPVDLKTYAQRCLKAASDGKGYPTSISVGGLRLHQGAKPCTYLYLERDADGNWKAVTDIPTPDPQFSAKPFAAGDIVIPAAGKAIAKHEAKKAVAHKK